tara:strand:+ start:6378 stop:6824 length:447 start_codon:yes stop_codon:yes gene_type:complete
MGYIYMPSKHSNKSKSTYIFDDGKPYFIQRLILRLIDIGLLAIYFLFMAIFFSTIIHKVGIYLFPVDPNNIGLIILALCFYAISILWMAYIIRHIIRIVPFPFDKIYGYQHSRVSERFSGGAIIGFSLIVFLEQFKEKLKLFNAYFNI